MSFAAFEATIVSPALKAIARHWNEARGARRMPGWSNLKPSAMAPHLPIVWACTYDRVTDTFTGRLGGERITSLFGKTFRGLQMAEDYQYPAFFARAKRIVTEPAFMRGHGLVYRHLDRYGTGERIMMPLADDGEHGDGVFGATEYNMSSATPTQESIQAGEAVSWFRLD
jgi:hypothetical protein